MKRMSIAEQTLKTQIERIDLELKYCAAERDQLSVKYDTLRDQQIALEAALRQHEAIRKRPAEKSHDH